MYSDTIVIMFAFVLSHLNIGLGILMTIRKQPEMIWNRIIITYLRIRAVILTMTKM